MATDESRRTAEQAIPTQEQDGADPVLLASAEAAAADAEPAAAGAAPAAAIDWSILPRDNRIDLPNLQIGGQRILVAAGEAESPAVPVAPPQLVDDELGSVFLLAEGEAPPAPPAGGEPAAPAEEQVDVDPSALRNPPILGTGLRPNGPSRSASAMPAAEQSMDMEVDPGSTLTGIVPIDLGPIDIDTDPGLRLSPRSVLENSAAGTFVGFADAKRFGGDDDVRYRLLDDAGGRFTIDPFTGLVTVAAGAVLDFETAPTHVVRIAVTDGAERAVRTFTIQVLDVDDTAPSDVALRGGTVPENSPSGTRVGTVSANDTSDLTFALIDDAAGRFTIDAATGVISVDDGAVLDFEAAQSHVVTVAVSDGTNPPATQTFTIRVTDVNEAPTDLALAGGTVAEDIAVGAAVGTVSALDPDRPAQIFTYSLADSAGGRFSISATTGVITVERPLDFETAQSHVVRVVVNDQGGLSYTESFTIRVTDLNEAPTDLMLAGNTVTENATAGTVVGTVTALDPDQPTQSFTYSLTDSAGGQFAIAAATGVIMVAGGINFEAAATRIVSVRVNDQGGLAYTEAFTIQVADINEAPVDMTLAGNLVTENATTGTIVGTVTTLDPDIPTQTFTYSLLNDAMDRFSINASSGRITVLNPTIDFETNQSHVIQVRVNDQGGLAYTESFTIGVVNVDEAVARSDLVFTNGALVDIPLHVLTLNDGAGAVIFSVQDPVNGTVSFTRGVDDDIGFQFNGGQTMGSFVYRLDAGGVPGGAAGVDVRLTVGAAIDGDNGNNILVGRANASVTLRGNGGNDILVGGFSSDLADGGGGNDTYAVIANRSGAQDQFNGGLGIDTILLLNDGDSIGPLVPWTLTLNRLDGETDFISVAAGTHGTISIVAGIHDGTGVLSFAGGVNFTAVEQFVY